MPTARRSVIVPHSCETMFDLVDDVARYPEFLPWCREAIVLERTDAVTRARLEIDYHGLRTSFTTRNRKARPRSMALELVEGPFEAFGGEWTFVALGEAGCRVELALEYEIAAGPLRLVMAPLFSQIAATMVEHFVDRAQAVDPQR